jgi:uncharacterized protein (TIGR03437 family)
MMRALLVCLLAVPLAPGQDAIRLIPLVSGLRNPVDIQSPRDGSGWLFVVEQAGRIRIVRDAALVAAPFLDISGRLTSGGERGLLGLAFPPGYASKRHFYVNYTDRQGNTVVSRFRVTANPAAADPDSERILLTVPQPFSNHNGGQLQFGPDGYLYIGLGDGGSANDPQNNSQNRRQLLGKMLRLDVESDLNEVRVPPGNPFVGDPAYDPRIWALGLRNPWRYSFDRAAGDLWIADVGQNRFEEVNFQPASSRGGENYGWVITEGLECVRAGCDRTGLTPPVHVYPRSEGVSVTGGYVYRGRRYPALAGQYLYGDYGSGRIWALTREGTRFTNRLLLASGIAISSFGEDEEGELYLADHGGRILQIAGTETLPAPRFSAASTVNAASHQPGLTPGSLATVYGTNLTGISGIQSAEGVPLPSTMAGVTVSVSGRTAPIYAVANVNGQQQVNFQTPFETPAGAPAAVIVSRDGVASQQVEVPVLAAQPGIFTLDGVRAIVVRAADNTLVTAERPLRPGERAYFYATGLGAVDPVPVTGQGAPREPLSHLRGVAAVTLGAARCEVEFAGLAPDLVGVFQINIVTPPTAPAGASPLRVEVDGQTSPPAEVPVGP